MLGRHWRRGVSEQLARIECKLDVLIAGVAAGDPVALQQLAGSMDAAKQALKQSADALKQTTEGNQPG